MVEFTDIVKAKRLYYEAFLWVARSFIVLCGSTLLCVVFVVLKTGLLPLISGVAGMIVSWIICGTSLYSFLKQTGIRDALKSW